MNELLCVPLLGRWAPLRCGWAWQAGLAAAPGPLGAPSGNTSPFANSVIHSSHRWFSALSTTCCWTLQDTQSCQLLGIYFFDTPQNDTANPKLSTIECRAWPQSGTGIEIHPHIYTEDCLLFSPFKIHFSIEKEGGDTWGSPCLNSPTPAKHPLTAQNFKHEWEVVTTWVRRWIAHGPGAPCVPQKGSSRLLLTK